MRCGSLLHRRRDGGCTKLRTKSISRAVGPKFPSVGSHMICSEPPRARRGGGTRRARGAARRIREVEPGGRSRGPYGRGCWAGEQTDSLNAAPERISW
jgi:hypothetical protein